MRCKTVIIFLVLGMLCATGCALDLKRTCDSNEECIEGYLCDKNNQCVKVEQENMEILITELDDAIVGKEYSYNLSVRGGLMPYVWSVVIGPKWLATEEDAQTGDWKLVGIPPTYQADAVALQLKVTDSSIGDGQTESKDLSIKLVYCSQQEEEGEACSGHGTCDNEGTCGCDTAYAGNQCELCDEENGYQLNEKQECVRYEYMCEGDQCGADVLVRECKDEACQGVNWETKEDCTANMICRTDEQGPACIDCGALHGCSDSKCQGCDSSDPCCDEFGKPLPAGGECDRWTEYRCKSPLCGGEGQKRELVQSCNGASGGCDGEVIEEMPWTTIENLDCMNDQICVSEGGNYPACVTCDHGCSDNQCWDCNPTSNGCCTSEGVLIESCWYDEGMNLAWQNPPFGGTKVLNNAKADCDGLVLGDKSDWRLPTISELRSLVRGCAQTRVTQSTNGVCRVLDSCIDKTDCYDFDECNGCDYAKGPGQNGCYWDAELLGSCSTYGYWSSSEFLDPSSNVHAWGVYFHYGYVAEYTKNTYNYVRCVRSGP